MKARLFLCFALVLSSVLAAANCRAAIVYPKAPEGGRQVVREGLGTLSRSISRYLEGFQTEDLTIGKPFRDYSVGAANIASGQLLSAAQPGAWRYPLMHGTNLVATAKVIAGGTNGSALRFAGLDTTGPSRETPEALRKAEGLHRVQKTPYELRCLNCPAILFTAVWLHGKSDDIIIPLPPTGERWKAYQPYSASEMIKLLKPAAEKRLSGAPGTPSRP